MNNPVSLQPSRDRNMEIELSEEQRLLRDTCREFADRELKPNAKRWDREHKYPAETVKKAFELGLAGSPFRRSGAARAWTTSPMRSRSRRSPGAARPSA